MRRHVDICVDARGVMRARTGVVARYKSVDMREEASALRCHVYVAARLICASAGSVDMLYAKILFADHFRHAA